MFEIPLLILFFIFLVFGYLKSKTDDSDDSRELKILKRKIYIVYAIGIGVCISIYLSNKAPIDRFAINTYSYFTNGCFYDAINLGYTDPDIDKTTNGVKALLIAVIALFLPALFSLYTSFRKDLYSIYKDNESPDAKKEIIRIEVRYQYLQSNSKLISRTLFILLICILTFTFCIDGISNLNAKGDLANIFQSISYIIFIGYTLLLSFYYWIVIPLYKKIPIGEKNELDAKNTPSGENNEMDT